MDDFERKCEAFLNQPPLNIEPELPTVVELGEVLIRMGVENMTAKELYRLAENNCPPIYRYFQITNGRIWFG